MKKMMAALIAVSFTIALAQSLPTTGDTSTGSYGGTVNGRCLIQDDLNSNGEALFDDTDGDGFDDSATAEDSFTYQSNTDCTIDLDSNATRDGALAAGTSTCTFDGGEADGEMTQDIEFTPIETDQEVLVSYSNGGAVLQEGDYDITCEATISVN